jgi:hypothetical protein
MGRDSVSIMELLVLALLLLPIAASQPRVRAVLVQAAVVVAVSLWMHAREFTRPIPVAAAEPDAEDSDHDA